MAEKKKTRTTGYILVLLAAAASSVGSLFWKFSADSNGAMVTVWFLLGLLLSTVGMFLLMFSFRFGEVSILQPMMSMGYALSVFLGYWFLGEPITKMKIIGVILITIGAAILGYEPSQEAKEEAHS